MRHAHEHARTHAQTHTFTRTGKEAEKDRIGSIRVALVRGEENWTKSICSPPSYQEGDPELEEQGVLILTEESLKVQ